MHEIILEKFDEWTRNLSPKEGKIRIFEKIRDIPFIITRAGNLESSPAELLIHNQGHCLPKHLLLGIMYQKLNIQIKYAIYSFRWCDQDINYPKELRKVVEDLPPDHHLACKACIHDEWILLDATWDPPLKRVGFPVNEGWDGVHDTVNAVKSSEETLHASIREGIKYVGSRTYYSEEQYVLWCKFYDSLNRWLKDIRK
jgi:hypothetical protein